MQRITNDAVRYDGATITFHWAIAALVVFQWIGAQTIDFFPKGALRVDARSMHIVAGVALAALLLARIAWRATGGRRLPPADAGALHILAKATHYALYALLIAMLGVGLFLEWARGDMIFNLFAVPALDPGNREFADQVQDVHAAIGWAIVALVGLHAGAALFHRYLWRDGVLGRMIPGA